MLLDHLVRRQTRQGTMWSEVSLPVAIKYRQQREMQSEPDKLDLIKLACQRAGYEVTGLSDVEKGLDTARSREERLRGSLYIVRAESDGATANY